VLGEQLLEQFDLVRVLRGNAILVALVGDGVGHALVLRHRQAHFVALRGGDPALLLQVFPRHVVLLRADQREHVGLAPVFAHERRRQAQPPPRLDLRRDAEDGRRQQVHLIVDDQAPVALVEQRKVRKLF
jgi:hypothetical protein